MNALAETKPRAQDHDPTKQATTKRARDTNESPRRPLENDQQFIAIIYHRSELKKLNFRSRPKSGGTEGQTPQTRTPDPSHTGIVSRTQLRSLARTHARNANASAIEIDFPVRGAVSRLNHTPNLRYVNVKENKNMQICTYI